MRCGAWVCLVLVLTAGSAGSLTAGEGGQENLQYLAGLTRPTMEWPLTLFADTIYSGMREGAMFPFRLMDLGAYPDSYYWDYGTGDYWSATRYRPIVPPPMSALPAMPRKLKDSEQPRLLPDSLRPEVGR